MDTSGNDTGRYLSRKEGNKKKQVRDQKKTDNWSIILDQADPETLSALVLGSNFSVLPL